MLTAEATDLLIETSVRLLRQAEALLAGLDAATYRASPPAIAPHRAGGHLRHILEFYECFLDGAPSGCIDYDARKRDLEVETDREAALTRIDRLIRRLQRCDFAGGRIVQVRMEDGDEFLVSSIARELQVLCSHTVHHFALMALVLRVLGAAVDPNFGMAPSTLRHLAEAARCAR